MSWSYVWPIALAVALIIVGGLLYHEAITVNKVIGVAICLWAYI